MKQRTWMVWVGGALLMAGGVGYLEASSTVPREAMEVLRRIPIQHKGRHKPFDSFARETVKHVTGQSRIEGQDPVVSVISMMAEPEPWQAKPLLAVPFRPLREALGLEPHTSRSSYNDLVASRKLMRLLPAIVQKQQRGEKLTMLEQETMDAFDRFVSLSNLFEQKLELVPSTHPTERSWLSILEQADALRQPWSDLLSAIRAGRVDTAVTSSRRLAGALAAVNPAAYPARWRVELEVFYNHAAPFRIAQGLYGLAILGLLLQAFRRAGWAVLVAAFAVHGAGILMRVMIGGRPPVSNFYETMLWLPFVGMLLALVFERIYRVRYFALAAAMLSLITLVLADLVPLDSSIAPVVAVLRSNLWLTVHVLTIVASYGALALATVLAHIYGVVYLSRRARASSLEALDLFLYRAIQVGVVLLAGGIMLGAVWANASWGRYWGWDPKETWALITLLWFLATLHGRFAGWLSGVWVAVATITGFFLLLMTYYGVSFYLVGLHSYAGGHAKPLPPLLVGYLLAELIFITLVGAAALRRNRVA